MALIEVDLLSQWLLINSMLIFYIRYYICAAVHFICVSFISHTSHSFTIKHGCRNFPEIAARLGESSCINKGIKRSTSITAWRSNRLQKYLPVGLGVSFIMDFKTWRWTNWYLSRKENLDWSLFLAWPLCRLSMALLTAFVYSRTLKLVYGTIRPTVSFGSELLLLLLLLLVLLLLLLLPHCCWSVPVRIFEQSLIKTTNALAVRRMRNARIISPLESRSNWIENPNPNFNYHENISNVPLRKQSGTSLQTRIRSPDCLRTTERCAYLAHFTFSIAATYFFRTFVIVTRSKTGIALRKRKTSRVPSRWIPSRRSSRPPFASVA